MTQHDKKSLKNSELKNASSINQDIVRKYVELFDRLPIGVYRTSPDGKILTANPAFLSMLGYNDINDLEGIDLNKTYKSTEGRQKFIKEIEDRGEVYAKESVMLDANGNDIIVEEYAKAYKNENGDVLFYEGIVINITDKKRRIKRIDFLNDFKELILNLTTSFINIRVADIDDQIVHSLKCIGGFIGADRSFVFLFDDDEMKHMSNTHESVAEGITPLIDELYELSTSDYSWWIDKLKKNETIIIPAVEDLPDEAGNEKKLFIHQHIKSFFAVPMFFEYRLIGFLGFDMAHTHKFIDDDALELLNIAACVFAGYLNYQKTELEIANRRKQLELLVEERTQDLEDLNRHFKMLAEYGSDVIWTMDLDFQITYISPSVYKQLGYTPEEYIAMPVEKRLPTQSIAKAKKALSTELNLIKSGKKKTKDHSAIFEMQYKTKKRGEAWGEISFNILLDRDANPIGVHGITREIHERKLAEQALWESNERFKALVENTSDWIWECNTKGIYTYASPLSEEVLGYKPDEMIGKSFYDFLDPASRKNNLRFFRNMANTKKPFKNHENIAVHKNGRRASLETSGVPVFNINGDFIGYRGINRDITEKKSIESSLRHSQLKLSQHMRNTPMGYIEWDNNLEVIEWNPAAQKIFGYNKTQAMLGNMIEKLMPYDESKEVVRIFPEILDNGQSVCKVSQCLTRDGKTISCEWFITPLLDESDRISGLATLVREIPQVR